MQCSEQGAAKGVCGTERVKPTGFDRVMASVHTGDVVCRPGDVLKGAGVFCLPWSEIPDYGSDSPSGTSRNASLLFRWFEL